MNHRTVSDAGEFSLLRSFKNLLPGRGNGRIVPCGDDAAVVEWPTGQGVITTDTLVEGTHFRLDWSGPEDVATKLLSMNLSDVAAMGGVPHFALLALTLPPSTEISWLNFFYGKLTELCGNSGVALIGGDTTEGSFLVFTLTLIGSVPPGTAITFDTAQPGDRIFVTGALGASLAGYEILSRKGKKDFSDVEKACVQRHLAPTARWKEAPIIREQLIPSAMTDISDGLQSDLTKLASASGVGYVVYVESIPIDPSARLVADSLHINSLDLAISSGEEFELIFTLPASRASRVGHDPSVVLPITEIGEITSLSDGMKWLDASGRDRPIPEGYEHFRNTTED